MLKLSKGLFTRNNIVRAIFIVIVFVGGIVLLRNNREGFDQDQDNILVGKLLSTPLDCGGGVPAFPRYSGTCSETYTPESGNHDKLQYCVNEADINPNTPIDKLQQSIDVKTCALLTKHYNKSQLDAMNQNPDGTPCPD